MLNHLKRCTALFNGLALPIVAAAMIVAPILETAFSWRVLSAGGTVLEGCNDFKKYRFKVDMYQYAHTTCAKTLTEMRMYV